MSGSYPLSHEPPKPSIPAESAESTQKTSAQNDESRSGCRPSSRLAIILRPHESRRSRTTWLQNNGPQVRLNMPSRRRNVATADGWTTIAHSSLTATDVGIAHTPTSPKPPPVGTSVDTLSKELNKFKAQWATSDCRTEVRSLVERALTAKMDRPRTGAALKDMSDQGNLLKNQDQHAEAEDSVPVHVQTAMCIGLGSVSAEGSLRYRSLWQLALFLELVGLAGSAGRPYDLFAYDPGFNALDKRFLSSLSISCLDKQENAVAHLGHESLIFAPFVDYSILLSQYLDANDPWLFVGNNVDEVREKLELKIRHEADEKHRSLHDIATRFLLGRERAHIPDFQFHQNALDGLALYWRKVAKS